jgi:tRNA 5-methylaminomethyl-2-thiouridine biosynthesis bifunctional protein
MAVTAAWAGQPQWRILDTAFGDGLNFLAAWRGWKGDPQRPRILHYVAIAEGAPQVDGLPDAHAWYGLLPGVQRLVFEQGHVLLTLCIGDTERLLRELDFHADAVLLHGAAAINPKALARCCRRGTGIVVDDPAGTLRPALERHGFVLHAADSARLHGEFAPAWEPRGRRPKEEIVPGTCIVIGAGLAGAAAAASMARRGWSVRVLDGAPAPASGASGLPAGVLVPHGSPDDNLLSRLSRDGVRATLQQAQALLVAGRDFESSGVLEHHLDGAPERPAVPDARGVWSRPAGARQKELAGLDAAGAADWHEKAAWIRPAALVQAWLAQPGVQVQCDARVAMLLRGASGWQAMAADGRVLASGEIAIVAAAFASQDLVAGLTLQPVRGQVTWALHGAGLRLPPFPVNGDGSFIPSLPTPEGPAWICGASFERGDSELAAREQDQQDNLHRLRRLLPAVSGAIDATSHTLRAWTGIRCASTDRRPLVGPVRDDGADGLWLSTAMGSRGLTFAALAAELIAARIHGEPLPLARKLALALDPRRQRGHFTHA